MSSDSRILIFSILFLSFFLSCTKVRQKTEWGYKGLEFKKEYVLLNKEKEYEFDFTPSEKSSNYEIRIYFPEVVFDETEILFNNLRDSIRTSLDNFYIFIVEKKSNQVVLEKKLSTEKKSILQSNFSSNKGEPLALTIDSKIVFSPDKVYRIRVKIPKRENNSVVKVLELGIGKARKAAL